MGEKNLKNAIIQTSDQQIQINNTLSVFSSLLNKQKDYMKNMDVNDKDYDNETKLLNELQKSYDNLLYAANTVDKSLNNLKEIRYKKI